MFLRNIISKRDKNLIRLHYSNSFFGGGGRNDTIFIFKADVMK